MTRGMPLSVYLYRSAAAFRFFEKQSPISVHPHAITRGSSGSPGSSPFAKARIIKQKKRLPQPSRISVYSSRFLIQSLLGFLHFCETVAAINRTVFTGLERNLRFLSAGRANCRVHLTRGTSGALAGIAAYLTSLRLIFETARCVEFLFSGREDKFVSTIFAYKGFVFVHCFLLSSMGG